MSRDITSVSTAIAQDEVFPFFAVELMFDTEEISFRGATVQSEPLYLWSGIGDLTVGGITYVGTGALLNISDVTETADIRAAGASITLAGLDPTIIALAISQPYQGRLCKIKFGVFENNVASDLIDLFVGYMDQMTINEAADSCTIQLSVESKLIDLERPRTTRYTAESQKSTYPNDLAFDFIPELQDQPLTWGRA